MTRSLPITPDTRVAELLDAYPSLEDVLIQQAPAFKALKNPVLRRTVAKVATLSQAARVGGVPVRRLIVALRRAAGQPVDEVKGDSGSSVDSEISAENTAAPDWLDESKVHVTIDADALLATGESPLAKVQHALRELSDGEIIRITSNFRPEPLIDTLQKRSIPTHVVHCQPNAYHTYVRNGRLPR